MLSGLQAGADADAANLLATLTTRHVLLFDLRRPAQPLLQWPHGLEAARPQLLSLFCRPGPANAVRKGAFCLLCRLVSSQRPMQTWHSMDIVRLPTAP